MPRTRHQPIAAAPALLRFGDFFQVVEPFHVGASDLLRLQLNPHRLDSAAKRRYDLFEQRCKAVGLKAQLYTLQQV